jgi:hypothetical protein
VSNTLSDPYLFVAFWTGVGALGLTLALGLQIVILRVMLRRSQRLEQRTIALWRPILSAASAGDIDVSLPKLARKDRIAFLKLWVHLHASMRGAASIGLNAVGKRLDCGGIATRLLEHGNRTESLLAILVLGYLREAAALPLLLRRADEVDGAMSSHAAWALAQIDPAGTAPRLVELAVARDTWSLPLVVMIFQEGGDVFRQELMARIPKLERELLLRALRIAEGLNIMPLPELHETLLCSDDAQIIVAGLRLVAFPQLLPIIRKLSAHADWRVRVQAAKLLGRVGEAQDAELLKQLLADREWWVRYRAAGSLARLPSLPREELISIADGAEDRYAADMIRQVLAEVEAT